MIVQIYEASSVKEAQELAKAGVDYVGTVVGKSVFGTELTAEEARKIFSSLPKRKKGVLLTLSCDLREISEIVRKAKPDILHLCALPKDITPRDIVFLKKKFPDLKIMRTIPVTGAGGENIALAKDYENFADYLLLDSYKKGDSSVGATGETHNWNISRMIVKSVKTPVILAGGLGPDNVKEAIRAVKPYGVDSKTKTDKKLGKGKDLTKVLEFVRKAKAVRTTP